MNGFGRCCSLDWVGESDTSKEGSWWKVREADRAWASWEAWVNVCGLSIGGCLWKRGRRWGWPVKHGPHTCFAKEFGHYYVGNGSGVSLKGLRVAEWREKTCVVSAYCLASLTVSALKPLMRCAAPVSLHEGTWCSNWATAGRCHIFWSTTAFPQGHTGCGLLPGKGWARQGLWRGCCCSMQKSSSGQSWIEFGLQRLHQSLKHLEAPPAQSFFLPFHSRVPRVYGGLK